MAQPLRAGIIGCGRIVEEGHVAAFKSFAEEVRVVALADTAAERTEAIGNILNVPPTSQYADYLEMLGKEQLAFVDIALPHFLHREAAVACAKANVHILMDKPMATTLEEADDIVHSAETAGVKLGIFHNYRYGPREHTAIGLVEGGLIGRPYAIRIESMGYGVYAGTPAYDPHWRLDKAKAGGGGFLDGGYHHIYVSEALMQSPVVSVFGRVGTYVRPISVEDTAMVLMQHANGGITSIQVGISAHGGGTGVFEVYGTEGTIRLGRQPEVAVHTKGEWTTAPTESPYEGFAGDLREWIDSLRGVRPHPVDGGAGRHILAVVLAGYKSAVTGVSEQPAY